MGKPATDAGTFNDSRNNPSPVEVYALRGVRVLGLLGIPFAFILALFTVFDAWQLRLTSALLLIGAVSLAHGHRWAAVLVCGICWFGLATCVFDPFPGHPARANSLEELIYFAVHGSVAVALTILPPLCSRHLKYGFWTRPAANGPAAVIAVSAGMVWLGLYLQSLVSWESAPHVRVRIAALGFAVGAALVALCWRKRRQ